jgi:RHS repeat-associated protein
MFNGAATGSPITRFIHPDHLGSTNVVTDQNGNLVQLMDYYPYGATRIATSTYPTNEKRQYIGQMYDQGSGLSYLNARYYSGSQGQFLSEDPVFWGNPKAQNLMDPQSLDTYSYSVDNPITKKDPSGRCLYDGCIVEAVATLGFAGGIGAQAFHDYTTGDFSRRSISQNIATYAAAGGAGAIVAGGTAIAGAETVGLSLLARLAAAGLTAGGLTAGTDVGSNYALGQPTDPGGVAVDTGVNTLTAGTLELLPGVAGARPSSILSALSVFSKSHAARSGAEALFGTSMQLLGSTGYQFMSSGGWSWSGGSGAASKSSGGGGVGFPSILPRSQNPVGQSGGKPVYCWGPCGK